MSVRLWRLAALLAASGGVVMAGLGAARAEEALAPSAKWEPWVELGGYAANRPEARRGEAALWLPLAQNGRSLVFGDFRGKLFDDDQREGNAALGYRFMSASGWNPGFWVGFDRRRSELGTEFDQVSFGGELLSADWDLRVNGYVPLNDSVLLSSSSTPGGGDPTVELIGNQLFLVSIDGSSTSTSLYELAFWGVDAEVGFRVPLERLGLDRREPDAGRYHDLRLFAGGYYFDHDDFDGEVFGPKLRAEWRIENILDDWEGSRLTFEASYQYDDVREEQMEAGVRLRIPLGGSTRPDIEAGGRLPLTRQEKRMAEGLKRDTDIVSMSQTQTTGGAGARILEPVEDALSGVALNTVVFVANGDDLNAVTASADNAYALIMYDGTGGAQSTAITLGANRTLLGGGTLQVRGQTSGRLANYTAPGTSPTISQLGMILVTMENNSHISNVRILGNSIGVVSARNNVSMFLSNLEINNGEGTGIINENDNVSIAARSITITNVYNGLLLEGAGVNLDIRDSVLSDVDNVGIGLGAAGGSVNVTVADTAFSGQFGTALFYLNDGTNTFSGSTGNIDNGIMGTRCNLAGGTFNGSISFTDNTTITQADC